MDLPYSCPMTGEAAPPGGELEEVPPAGLRASHEDREQVAEALRVAAGDGRLSVEELGERLEKALAARTYGELAALTRDLPAGHSPAVEPPSELVRIGCRSGTAKREGRWVVPRRMEVRVRSGTVTLDFTEAVVTAPSLRVDASVGAGSLEFVIRPGIVVEAGDVAVRSGSIQVTSPWRPGVPVTLRIQVCGEVSSGTIRARPPHRPRRTFWQWLRRQPRPPLPYASARR
jgi:hypothetical protein